MTVGAAVTTSPTVEYGTIPNGRPRGRRGREWPDAPTQMHGLTVTATAPAA
jgi:hypothetical protein